MRSRAGRRLTVLIFLLVLPLGAGAAPADTAQGMKLWHESVSVAERSAGSIPGSVYTSMTISDAHGDIKSSQQSWSRLRVGEGGAIVTTVVRSIKDGRDNTASAQRDLERHPERGRFDSSLLPMMPSNRGRVEVEPTGQTRVVDGIRCAGFSYRMRGDNGRVTEGTAWLEAKNGIPLLIEFTFEPLPPGASVIKNTLHFEVAPSGAWHLASLDTYAEGRLLFIARVFRLHMEFSDYFQSQSRARLSGTSH